MSWDIVISNEKEELAKLMGVTQAYVSKIENQDKVTAKMLKKIQLALAKK